MRITEIRLTKTPDSGNQLAVGSITLDGELVVSGIRVVKANDGGMFVAYPNRKNSKNEYKDICFPMTKALREDIQTQVLSKFESI